MSRGNREGLDQGRNRRQVEGSSGEFWQIGGCYRAPQVRPPTSRVVGGRDWIRGGLPKRILALLGARWDPQTVLSIPWLALDGWREATFDIEHSVAPPQLVPWSRPRSRCAELTAPPSGLRQRAPHGPSHRHSTERHAAKLCTRAVVLLGRKRLEPGSESKADAVSRVSPTTVPRQDPPHAGSALLRTAPPAPGSPDAKQSPQQLGRSPEWVRQNAEPWLRPAPSGGQWSH